jgi:hypothetical protein
MSNTYTWTITKLSCTDPDVDGDCSIISTASWDLSGSDANNTVLINGVTPLNLSMAIGEDNDAAFVTLTQNTVIEAVQTALGTNQVASYYNTIDKGLIDLAIPQPVLVSPVLPWAV